MKLLTTIFIFLSLVCSAQNADSSSNRPNIKNKIYISGGLGESTILYGLTYSAAISQGEIGSATGVSQSIVTCGAFDYGFSKHFSLGECIAYQTATCIPAPGNTTNRTEYLTRLNVSLRIFYCFLCTTHVQLSIGLRGGVSFWSDNIYPSDPAYGNLILGSNHIILPSVQLPIGMRIFPFKDGTLLQRFGFNVEAAFGTPYFFEAGLTYNFVPIQH